MNGSRSSHDRASTMIASGVDLSAKGMSYAGQLACHDWGSDQSEMANAAAGGMRISNHSYGFTSGWRYDGADWYWYGDITVSAVEDYGFGFYGQTLHAQAINHYYTVEVDGAAGTATVTPYGLTGEALFPAHVIRAARD